MQNFTTKPFVAVTQSAIHLPAGVFHLKASDYERLCSLQESQDHAVSIVAQAEQEAALIREQYRQEGLAQGREDAKQETLDEIAKMQSSLNEWVRSTDTHLVDLVNRCVQEIVTQVDPSILAKEAVDKGLSELINAQHINIRVHQNSPGFEENVDAMVKKHGISGQIRIIEDGTLEQGDVVVESPVGTVDLRIHKQLELIGRALK